MSAASIATASPSRRAAIGSLLAVTLKFVIGALLCLTAVGAIIVLGWLTRKLARDIAARLERRPLDRWPNWLLSDSTRTRTGWLRWLPGALVANFVAGARAWTGVLILTLPFSLVWLAGWFAGWENSFNKGYELSGVWPGVSLLAVLLSLPVWVILPMAIAHQAHEERLTSIFEFGRIARLIRSAWLSHLGLTLLIAVGCVGVFGARALPTFAEHISPALADGNPEAAEQFANRVRLFTAVLLFTGLLVVRHAMARVYAHALRRSETQRPRGWLVGGITFLICAALWLGLAFLIYVAQFLNYAWWSWINQPVLMLPWLGILP